MRRALFTFAVGLSVLVASYDARAQACGGSDDAGDDAGPCAFNQYCAYPDGGAILDGGAGTCQAEPCIVASDCPNGEICDTSQNPFACVQCISGSDCPGILVCDTTTHTCVNPPPVPEGGAEDGSVGDAAADASVTPDAAPPVDATVPPKVDASADASPAGEADSGPVVGPPDDGSLGGGAWDCGLAGARETPLAALAVPLAFLALFFTRRRSGRAKRD